MKKTLFLLLLIGSTLSAQTDSLVINYYENFPFAFSEGGDIKGIEIDIIAEYVKWLKAKKNITVKTAVKPYKEFSAFYNSVKSGGKHVVGLGSVTSTREREKEVLFSAPYLQNVAVMITAGSVPTFKTKAPDEVRPAMEKLEAMVVKQSSHSNYIEQVKSQYAPSLKITYTESQEKVLENIAGNSSIMGYVDIVAYWSYLKKNPSKFLKMQKAFSEPKDHLGFIMPMGSSHYALLNEFFESGFGFTSTRTYHQILEKYLGYEILESVEIK
jgi:ABC-type amino acid transport substrate-binding protein